MIIAWNVRGMNMRVKLAEIGPYLKRLGLPVVVLTETRVRKQNADKVRKYLGRNWNVLDNYDNHSNGRIWILWNPMVVKITLIESSSQLIHCYLENINGNFACHFTAIYGLNKIEERRELWEHLDRIGLTMNNQPWLISGDFNSVLGINDRLGGNLVQEHEIRDFANCLINNSLFEIQTRGGHFTWCNQRRENLIYSKIDWAFGNLEWMRKYNDIEAEILTPGISDHNPILIHCPIPKFTRYRQFRFLNCLADDENFLNIVQQCWNTPINGCPLYVIWEKLKLVRNGLKQITPNYTQSAKKIVEFREKLENLQSDFALDPLNMEKFDRIKDTRVKLEKWHTIEESILLQKSKITHIKLGDGNNAYFYANVKERNRTNGIHTLQSLDGRTLSNDKEIEDEIVGFYINLLGTASESLDAIDLDTIRNGPQLTNDQKRMLIQPVTDNEITKIVKGLNDNKAPGIDGFNSKFFKASWSIIGKKVTHAVKDFFKTGKMLKAISNSLVTLIPKTDNAKTIKEYRPISCCTTMYKVISKIITKRMSLVLDTIIDDAQSAFVPGKHIQDNIILAHELVRCYSRKHISPRCMLKIDLQKAFDSVEWVFIDQILREYGFPQIFVHWIMECLKTVSYQIVINGRPSRRFEGKKGLRQGDPLSPLLFVLAMEYLSRNLKMAKNDSRFHFHPKCSRLNITHVCFADDLLLFSRGDLSSLQVLMEKFGNFSKASGLKMNPSKCELYFGGVTDNIKTEMLSSLGFKEGLLPFKYLGVPLASRKLSTTQCQPLIDKMVSKIKHWSSRLLSYSGRVQLIKSVLFAVQNYWSQVFPLTQKVIKIVESICRQFLWIGTVENHKKSPIAWEFVCSPNSEGGLGIVDICAWNKANMSKLMWAVSLKADKLWVKWVHAYYIKRNNIRTYELPVDASWILKGILKTRKLEGFDPDQPMKTKILYNKIRHSYQQKPWKRLIIENKARPRAVFITWLYLWKRLSTKDRLLKFGIVDNMICPLCDADESNTHLFFECCRPLSIWKKLMRWLGMDHVVNDHDTEINWLINATNGRRAKKKIILMVFAEFVYNIWQARNQKVFNDTLLDTNHVIKKVICSVKTRCECFGKLKRAGNRLGEYP